MRPHPPAREVHRKEVDGSSGVPRFFEVPGVGGVHVSCMDAADANDDGAIDVGDAIRTLSHLFGGTGPLPEPFEACGNDPAAADGLGCVEFRPCA